MASKVTDVFANIAYLSVAESAANTLTFARLQVATTLMTEKAALILHRAEIQMDANAVLLDGNTDIISMAITVSDRLSSIRDLSQPEILCSLAFQRNDYGAAASGTVKVNPDVLDFTNLPGSGIIVPADQLFIGVHGSGLAVAGTAKCRLYYTVKSLKTDEYWELIEARRVMRT